MAKLSTPKNITPHEYRVAYRAALAEKRLIPGTALDEVKQCIREQYTQEQKWGRKMSPAPNAQGSCPELNTAHHD